MYISNKHLITTHGTYAHTHTHKHTHLHKHYTRTHCILIHTVIILVPIVVLFILVEKNGDVCISILHEPGEDKWGYEKAEERWLPIHTVETILISVISMLADPNDESPANVDAAVSYKCGVVCIHNP